MHLLFQSLRFPRLGVSPSLCHTARPLPFLSPLVRVKFVALQPPRTQLPARAPCSFARHSHRAAWAQATMRVAVGGGAVGIGGALLPEMHQPSTLRVNAIPRQFRGNRGRRYSRQNVMVGRLCCVGWVGAACCAAAGVEVASALGRRSSELRAAFCVLRAASCVCCRRQLNSARTPCPSLRANLLPKFTRTPTKAARWKCYIRPHRCCPCGHALRARYRGASRPRPRVRANVYDATWIGTDDLAGVGGRDGEKRTPRFSSTRLTPLSRRCPFGGCRAAAPAASPARQRRVARCGAGHTVPSRDRARNRTCVGTPAWRRHELHQIGQPACARR